MTRNAAIGSIRVERVAALRHIRRSNWDALCGAGAFYLCHDWLSYVEREAGVDAGYLIATYADQPGGLAGAMPIYTSVGETYGNYETTGLLDGRVPGRFVIAGTCRAYLNDLLLSGGHAPDGDALGVLFDAADITGRALGRDGAAFLYLTTPAARRMVEAREDLTPLLLGLDTELELPDDRFEDYLSALGKKKSFSVQREAADFKAAGYELAVEKLSQCWYEMGPLVAQVQAKYGNPDTAESCRASLRMQADVLDRHTLVFTARRDGALAACALFYAWWDTLYGRVVGFDYASLRGAAEYFNIYFYEPARYAYSHGYRRLRLGRGSYFAKFRRGAQARALWGIFTSAEGHLPDFRQVNGERLRGWQEEWQFTGSDVPPEWLPNR
jgi:hypothetical protein